MLNELDKRENTTEIFVEPNEGERTLLSSNESGMRSPSLDLTANISKEEEMLLNELAQILFEAILLKTKYATTSTEQRGSDLLPGIN